MFHNICLQTWIQKTQAAGKGFTCPLCKDEFYMSEIEKGVSKKKYATDDKYRFKVRDRTKPVFPPFPTEYANLLNRGMNLQDMYRELRNGIQIYDKLSDEAKETWIFSKPMAEIERTINNVQEYFMSYHKHFHSLATTVRSDTERYYEYESISSVNTDDYTEDSSYPDTDE